jgi:hypothetical protein
VESEPIKMEVGDNFVVISTELENGNPFMLYYVTNIVAWII